VPSLTNRQILLRRRPTGLVQPDDTELVTNPAQEPANGEALVRTTYIGWTPRPYLARRPARLPTRAPAGRRHPAAGIGEVVVTLRRYAVGDVVTTLTVSGVRHHPRRRVHTPIPGD
jgi:NADPH-dependent curcumin reductase CurA